MREVFPGGEPVEVTPDIAFALETLVRVLERQSREFRASILILSGDGKVLLDGAGPSLPREYRDAIHGIAIGPSVGSCGTAAHRKERVVVTDIDKDPLWADFRELAARFDLAACWSEPIRSSSGAVLGTFAMYYSEPRAPTQTDLALIQAAANRAASLLERARSGASRGELVADLI